MMKVLPRFGAQQGVPIHEAVMPAAQASSIAPAPILWQMAPHAVD